MLRPRSRAGLGERAPCVASFWVVVWALQRGGDERGGQPGRSACAARAAAAARAALRLAAVAPNSLRRERCVETGSWR